MSSFYAIASLLAGGGIGNTACHAALGLHRAGLLGRLVALGHRPVAIPDAKIADVRFLPRRALFFLDDKRFYNLKNRRFDVRCRRLLTDDFDPVHLWNSQATTTARQAVSAGRRLIIDRASTHIGTQTDLLVDAYRRQGIDHQPTFPETIDRCVEEYELADLVLTPSRASYQSFLDQSFAAAKLIRCPFGVDAGPPRPRPAPGSKFIALFVGQLGVRKGLPTLLEAWRRADLPGELWLVGGEEAAIASSLAPWRDRPGVRFLGYRNDVPDLMAQASAFVFPTIEEGSALVTYEAMAAGLPQVVTEVSGTVARDGAEALFVPPHDPDALAAALTRLAADPDLAARLGEAARRRVELFPWSAYGDRVALVHRMVAAGSSGLEIQTAVDATLPA
jgi:glycosyltransferase involved in cell wall biosynthesis